MCVYETLNPKEVSGDELYGYMTRSKDWKDGVLSIIMRGMSKNFADQGLHEHQTHKWVVLDGDIDTVRIESMNTVVDDNKVLTQVSNERVLLSSITRLVSEINSLKNATPATVSRTGILYINETDVRWKPLVIATKQNQKKKNSNTCSSPFILYSSSCSCLPRPRVTGWQQYFLLDLIIQVLIYRRPIFFLCGNENGMKTIRAACVYHCCDPHHSQPRFFMGRRPPALYKKSYRLLCFAVIHQSHQSKRLHTGIEDMRKSLSKTQ